LDLGDQHSIGGYLDMNRKPAISVVMPVYNGGKFLDEAVCSILDQTLRDFEFVIVDDGSTDGTACILEKYVNAETRLRVFRQSNEGIISALNRGCRLARGQYVARMDADDISLPHRLERQIDYIEKNPNVGIVGTWITEIEIDGSGRGNWCPSPLSKVLRWRHFFGGCVHHPSVLIRREILEKIDFYRPDAAPLEDIDLWLRASAITEFGNVPEVLFKYRVRDGSLSQSQRVKSREIHMHLMASFIGEFLGVDPPFKAVTGLKVPKCESLQQVLLAATLLELLYRKFVKVNSLNAEEIREISSDASKRMAFLAFQALRFSSITFVSLAARALRLNHRLLYPSVILRNLQHDRLVQLLGA
jgi:glycosyltransferase involved in cell wall biosynthesis